MKTIKIILRIIVSPFILGILLVTYNYTVFKRVILFLRYGGEWINYNKDDNKTIQDLYLIFKSNNTSHFTKEEIDNILKTTKQ